MTQSKPPTNTAGMVTLFEQRPWWHCPKHDVILAKQDTYFDFCYPCWYDTCTALAAARREVRISEQAEAMAYAIQAIEPIKVRTDQ